MKSYCLTDVGRKRTLNEDFVYASDQPVGTFPDLYIVADGMGGHNAGEYASRMAVESVVGEVQKSEYSKVIQLLSAAVQSANAAILSRAKAEQEMCGMGTTLVVAVVMEHCLYVANIGDSRLYIVSDRMEQITRDHSLVEEMVRSGQITRQQARNHPRKNEITRAVGVEEKIRTDFFDVNLEEGDIILLCSDGLTNMVTDEEIFKIIKGASSLEEAAKTLVARANENGGSDNISVILASETGSGV